MEEKSIGEKFVKHFAIIGCGTLISMIIGFLTTPIITRLVSPTSYGQVSVFLLYADMSVLLLYLGLDQAMVRYFYDDESDDYRRCLLFKCVRIPIITTFIAVIITIILQSAGIIAFELGTEALYALFLYVLLMVIYRFAQLLVRLQYKTKKYSALNVVQKIVYVSVAISLVCIGVTSDTDSLIIGYISAMATCVVVSILSESNIWDIRRLKRYECRLSSKELIKYAYPYVFTMGISTLFQAIDKISLNFYCGYEDVGIYTSALTLTHIFAVIQTSFNTLWTPMAVERYTKDPTSRQFYIKGNSAITVVMMFLGICLIFSKDLFALILGQEYREAAYIIPFLIFNPVMYTISETTVTGLVLMKKSKIQVLVMLVPCITNVIGNMLLVPLLGCRGAAISTGISYIVLFATRTLMSNKYFYIDYKLGKFYIVTACVVVYAGISTFTSFGIYSILGFFVCIGVLFALYHEEIRFLLCYALKIVNGILAREK